MKRPIPQELLDLQAERVRKQLSLAEVSASSGVGYSDVSRVLNGWLNHPAKLARIRRAIHGARRRAIA